MKNIISLTLASSLALSAACASEIGPADAAAGEPTFTERYRPQFHYTPRENWMNDPNGLVYYNGVYHLFHQYNPFGDRWGHMSWAHAVSTDLVHWEHRPVAIPEEGNEMIFSGSAVVDLQNTTGFQTGEHPPLVAIYTSHYTIPEEEGGGTAQAQSLAYSTDGGDTWTKYDGNPVLRHPDPDFRDPNVMWYEPTQRWIMVVALSRQYKVQFYESPDLINWTHLSDFGPAGSTGGIWECPDLFELPVDGDPANTRWVLQVDINPGAVAGGSGGQYFVGHFDGTSFTVEEPVAGGEPLWVDYGPDFYAAISWNNISETDGRRLWVGWMSNWMYAGDKPTSPWRSAQSVPRSVHLRTVDGRIRMAQAPVEELTRLRHDHVRLDRMSVQPGTVALTERGIAGNTLELLAEFEAADADVFGFKVRVGDNEETLIGYDRRSETLFVDRTNAGQDDFHEGFAARHEAPLAFVNGTLRLHILVDWSSVEVFANDGSVVFTSRIFPDPESTGVAVFSERGTAELVSLDAWQLTSIWHSQDQ